MAQDRPTVSLWSTAEIITQPSAEWVRARKTLHRALNPPPINTRVNAAVEWLTREQQRIAHRTAMQVKLLHPEEVEGEGLLPISKIMQLLFRELQLEGAGLFQQAIFLGTFAEDLGFEQRAKLGNEHYPIFELRCEKRLMGNNFKRRENIQLEWLFAEMLIHPDKAALEVGLRYSVQNGRWDLAYEMDQVCEEDTYRRERVKSARMGALQRIYAQIRALTPDIDIDPAQLFTRHMDEVRGGSPQSAEELIQEAKGLLQNVKIISAIKLYSEFLPEEDQRDLLDRPSFKTLMRHLREVKERLEKTFSQDEEKQASLDNLFLGVRYHLAILENNLQVSQVAGIKLLGEDKLLS